jgi:DNA repair exonuclease SbcCD nuclease subunit
MGVLDFLTGKARRASGADPADTQEERFREVARRLLQQIIVLENKIERYEKEFRRAESRGNDPNSLRADITATEIEKLDLERQLEVIDRRIVAEEKAKVERMRRAA